jgi:hypothetical protein
MRLLQSDDDGNVSLTEFFESAILNYAILSYRWATAERAHALPARAKKGHDI